MSRRLAPLALAAVLAACGSSQKTVVVSNDTVPPTVAIANLMRNGLPCQAALAPPGCVVKTGDLVSFDVQAGDESSVSAIGYDAYFASSSSQMGILVLVPAGVNNCTGAAACYRETFSFTVPGGGYPEDVEIVGLAVDGGGNRTSSTGSLLHYQPYFLAGGRQASLVSANPAILGPNDVAVDAAGTAYVANSGAGDLLRISGGVVSVLAWPAFSGSSRFIAVDSAGKNLFVSAPDKVAEVSIAAATVASYLSFGGGRQPRGLATVPPTTARGLVHAAAPQVGDSVTVGSVQYVFDAGGTGCAGAPAGSVCVPQTATTPACASFDECLASSVAAGNAQATARYATPCGAVTSCAVVTAKVAGKASVVLSSSAPLRVLATADQNGAAKLGYGFDEGLLLGQDGTADTSAYRYPDGLTAGLPLTVPAGFDTSYDVLTRPFSAVLRVAATSASPNLRDDYLYFVDSSARSDAVGFHFSSDLTQSVAAPVFRDGRFGQLYDLVVEPRGCLLLSDEGAGEIWSLDVTDPTNAAPPASLVASGLGMPRGLAIGPDGWLYVADPGVNAVVKISPSPSTQVPRPSCF